MKKTIILILCTVLLCAMLGCSNGGNTDEYKVEFTVDGTVYTFTGGYNNLDNPPEGCLSGGASAILIKATPEGAVNTDSYVLIGIGENSVGIYIETSSDIWFSSHTPDFSDAAVEDLNLEITTLQVVGGEISGTFSGTVNDGGDTKALTNGLFRVRRIADNSFVLN